MRAIFESIRHRAAADGFHLALSSDAYGMTYAELNDAIVSGAARLRQAEISTLAILADNGIPWVVGDLSALYTNIVCVPLPLFFSPAQMLHAIRDSGANGLLTDKPDAISAALVQAGIEVQSIGEWLGLSLLRLHQLSAVLPIGTTKITYTSGTTGEPKGVCLAGSHIKTVADALLVSSEASASDRHLCLTPLSTLLENIGGVYVPLLAGACCCVPSMYSVGLTGASGIDAGRMLYALHDFEASTAILAPQMLYALIRAITQGAPRPLNLRFLAVGGATVPLSLLEMASGLDFPVFEGYGLSECASVVSLNTPAHRKIGTVGRPLSHRDISIADDGEILIGEAGFLGYLGGEAAHSPWATGDIGFIDAEGFLHVTGRKKNMFITSFGRNISPEWVEGELTLRPQIAQAAVFGEGRSWNCAVLVPHLSVTANEVEVAVRQANQTLPDYARIVRWIIADAAFTTVNGQLTPNGRLRRATVFLAYRERIESLYQEEIHAVL